MKHNDAIEWCNENISKINYTRDIGHGCVIGGKGWEIVSACGHATVLIEDKQLKTFFFLKFPNITVMSNTPLLTF